VNINSGEFHSVVVVGTVKQDVLFVDPRDESDPKTPRKIYTMPYRLFQESIATLNGVKLRDETTNKIAIMPPCNGKPNYALYSIR
jgi:hypothetical protein